MPALRILMVAATIAAISAAPLLWGNLAAFSRGMPAYASTVDGLQNDGSVVRQSNDNDDNLNDNDDTNDNDDNLIDDGDDNDNDDNLNDNGDNANDNDDNTNDNDDDGDDNDNDEEVDEPAPAPPPSTGAGGGDALLASRCYDVGMVGAINLDLTGGSVTLTVVPASSFPRVSRVTLSPVDPAAVPAAPGGFLDGFVFEVQALDGCDGPALGQLPSAVNLGIAYAVPADKSRLRIARWDGGRWVDVTTVPDPNPSNPYISATIQQTGTYAVYQAP